MKFCVAILFASISVFFTFKADAQKFYERHEYGLMAGATQYFGDLNPEYGFKAIKPAGGIFYRYYFNPYISVRTSFSYAQIGYDDALTKNPYQKVRNLSFKNNILELMAVGEFNFFYFMTGVQEHRFTPYMVLGVGALYSNPFVKYNGKKTYLQELGTEGQFSGNSERKYNKVNVVVPFGAGVKYWLAPGVNLGIEVVHRFAFTDYLDDVSTTYIGESKFLNPNGSKSLAAELQDRSTRNTDGSKFGVAGKQRGDNATIDQYLMGQVTLSFQLKTYRCPSSHPLWNQQ